MLKRSFRLQVEGLESREQPGNVLPLGALSMTGAALFGDPLSGRSAEGSVSMHRLLNQVEAASSNPALFNLTQRQAVNVLAPVQATAQATPARMTSTQALSIAVGSIGTTAAPGQNGPVMAGDPIAIEAPTPIQATASDMVVQMSPLAGVSMVANQVTGEAGAEAVGLWASYNGGAEEDRELSAAVDTANGLFTSTGWSGAPGASVITATKMTIDGTAAIQARLEGVNAEGHGVDVDGAGTTYVVGSANLDGVPVAFVGSVSADLTVINWALTFTVDGATQASANGVDVALDGSSLLITGSIENNLFIAQLTNLDQAEPALVYGSIFQFADGPSVGNGVGLVVSTGEAAIATTIDRAGDLLPTVLWVAPDGQTAAGGFFESTGLGGGMNGVAVDGLDNATFSGSVSSPRFAGRNEVLIGQFDLAHTQLYGFIAGAAAADFIGYEVDIDSAGLAYQTRTAADGLAGDGNMGFLVWDFLTPAIVEQTGEVFGALNDQARGMALDEANITVYVNGWTNSEDFALTGSGFQPAYGGGSFDGINIGYITEV